MLDPTDTVISQNERDAAVTLLNAILCYVGDPQTGAVTAMDMHRIIALLAGAVLETDTGLNTAAEFSMAGGYLGELIAYHALDIRAERAVAGTSLIDHALAMDVPVPLN